MDKSYLGAFIYVFYVYCFDESYLDAFICFKYLKYLLLKKNKNKNCLNSLNYYTTKISA